MGAPTIANNLDLLDVLAHNQEERAGFQALERNKAQRCLQAKFPQGVDAAIRQDLLDIFDAQGDRIKSILRAREQFGIQGGATSESERKFNEWLRARSAATFVAEYNFLMMAGSLSTIARRALKEIVQNDPSRQIAHCKAVLERTLDTLTALRLEIPNYEPRTSRKLAAGESYNLHTHSASIDFVANSFEMNIRHATQIVLAIESFAQQTGSIPPPTATEIVHSEPKLKWLRDLIGKLIDLLNQFRGTNPKALPAPVSTEIPQPMKTLITMMELTQQAIGGLVVALEKHPSMYISQHMGLLHELANAAREAQGSKTTPQS